MRRRTVTTGATDRITARGSHAAAYVLAALAALSPTTVSAESPARWPQWRGPLGNGVSPDGDPPLRWSEGENVRFKVPIDGDGHATPIVWGDRIFVLSALAVREPTSAEGEPASRNAVTQKESSPGGVLGRQRFLVTAYDRRDGSVDWQRVASEHVPHEGHHLQSAWATGSPITDSWDWQERFPRDVRPEAIQPI